MNKGDRATLKQPPRKYNVLQRHIEVMNSQISYLASSDISSFLSPGFTSIYFIRQNPNWIILTSRIKRVIHLISNEIKINK